LYKLVVALHIRFDSLKRPHNFFTLFYSFIYFINQDREKYDNDNDSAIIKESDIF